MEGNNNIMKAYFPLWGVIFDSKEGGYITDKAIAYIPNLDEWAIIQKSDIFSERIRDNPPLDEFGFTEIGSSRPLYLVVSEPALKDENRDKDRFKQMLRMINIARDAILALRLYKLGWFLDPEMADVVFRQGLFNQRLVGPYRQIFSAGVPEEIQSRYILSINELTKDLDDESNLRLIGKMISKYKEKEASSTEIAIENFNRSFGISLTATRKAMFLFTAMDAIFIGMSKNSDLSKKLNKDIHFENRIQAALECLTKTSSVKGIEPKKESKWLNKGGRKIGNAVSHGRPYSVEETVRESIDRIQNLVRLFLRQYIEFNITWNQQKDRIKNQFKLKKDISLILAYNKILEYYYLNQNYDDCILGYNLSKAIK